MATFVGTQDNFTASLQALVEFEYDVIEAYEAAIHRLEDETYRLKLEEFKNDHGRHIEELSAILKKHNEKVPTGPSSKQWLTKGKVVVANIVGDRAILMAMSSNEDDSILAYERMVGAIEQWEDAKDPLNRGLADEMRHKAWLKQVLE
jgi:rubrerythrin